MLPLVFIFTGSLFATSDFNIAYRHPEAKHKKELRNKKGKSIEMSFEFVI